MEFSAIQQLLSDTFPRIKAGADESSTPKAILLSASELPEVMPFLHRDDRIYFDMLSNLTGLDNGAEAHTMEVIYTLYSIPFDHHLTVKVTLDRECPQLPSVSHIWQTANWHEREAYDLLGIRFDGHPDLRRILLPADWEGHPLRKDYRQQEKYHGITVAYDAADNTHSN